MCVCTDALKTDNLLKILNGTVDQLQRSIDIVQANVTAVRNKLTQTINNPNCVSCSQLQPELQKLTMDTTIVVSSI